MNRDANSHGSNRNSINEMEQIQRGLEEFLQQELREMKETETQSGGMQSPKSEDGPQFFTIGEEDEQEKEIDIIGSTGKNKKSGSRREDDYFEDWDSPAPRRSRSDSEGRTSRTAASAGGRSRSASEGRTSRPAASAGGRGRSDSEGRTSRSEASADGRSRSSSGGSAPRTKKSGRSNAEASDSRKKGGSRNGSQKSEENKPTRRKKKSGLKRFLIAAALILALGMGGIYFAVGAVYGNLHFEGIESVAAEPLKEDGVVNVLLIGNDSRENGEDGRSDAMILLSISNKTKKIYMTSLLRDMYVDIPGHDGNRLNAAYSFGGAELLMETVEQNFDIPVNRYVLVNFEAFANLVDAVGGIELELTSEEIEYVNGYLVEYNMLTNRPQGTDNMDTSVSGLVHLNGPQALAYSRNRYLGTDFGRTERQRKVLEAVIRKVPKTLITNPKGLFEGLMPNLTTNLTQGECFRLSLMAPKLLTYDIVQTSIPQEGTYQNVTIRKMQVLEVDFEANKKYLKENIYGTAEK